MNRTMLRVNHVLGGAAIAAYVAIASTASAQLNLADVPLFLGQNVKPTIMMAVDDSGSMDAEILLPSNDGAAWWHTGNQSFTGLNQAGNLEPDVVNYNATGDANDIWKKFIYLFPNGTGIQHGRRGYADSGNPHFAAPPFGEYGYLRSPAFNQSYFDPSDVYEPWPDLGGHAFTDANPTAAKTDPVLGSETFDLTTVQERTETNQVFRLYAGMRIPAGTRYRDWTDNTWKTAPSPGGRPIVGGGRGVPISYFPATFYLPVGTNLPDGYGYSAPPAPDGNAPDGSTLNRYEIKPENFASPAAYDAAIQNFANWFTYYRKRHTATRGAIGTAFEPINNFRIGAFTINNRVNPVPVRDLGNQADRDAFFSAVYEDFVDIGGTPNREAVNHMGLQLQRNSGANLPIEHMCQRNFGVLFTDGFSTLWTGSGAGNADGPMGAPFADGYANTIADIAMSQYETNLRPDLPAGQVPVAPSCNAANPDPSLDCQTDLHMNLFGITMGSQGTIFGVDEDATLDPFANPPAWPNPNATRNPTQVDDLWHATINSRGALLNVAVPSALGEQFSELLMLISDQLTSSSAIAANSTRLDTSTLIYQARFSTDDWAGELLAYPLQGDGSLGSLAWDAADQIPAPADRNIFTRTGAGNAVPFVWDDLDSAQQAALNRRPDGTIDNRGAGRVAWSRGDQALEEKNPTGVFRNRSAILGDIVNSNPKFVGAPNFGYEALPSGNGGSSYQDFRQSKLDGSDGSVLEPMIYVGANDGMLHGFDATTGEEMLAYLPSTLIPELNELMDPGYSHRYYVDGQIFVGDAYIDANGTGTPDWATVLVGTTGAGDRTVFALDVTDPDAFGANDVLWEFTDPDLGHVLGEPVVARMADGTWVAVFGNGYNSDDHRAVLFIVSLEDGTLLKKIDTGAGNSASPNGLATPALLADSTRTIRAIYAGDLLGNLWKFDVNASTNPSNNWDVAYQGAPLFIAQDDAGERQPITSGLEIGRHPDNGYMLYFGTGKFFEADDNLVINPQVQSFYGIWDKPTNPGGPITANRSSILTEHEILYEGPASGTNFDVRVTSENAVNWVTERGWYIDLLSPNSILPQGERVVSTPILRAGRIIFPTLIPDQNPCAGGGTSWLMELDAVSGSRLQTSPLDITEDGEIDAEDMVTVAIDGETVVLPVSGVKSREDIISTPAVIGAGEIEYKLASGTSGKVEILIEVGLFNRARGSWRQLR